ARAAAPQRGEGRLGVGTERARLGVEGRPPEQVEVLALEERHRGRAAEGLSAGALLALAPRGAAAEAERVEPARIVGLHAPGQEVGLEGRGRRLEALEPAEHLDEALGSVEVVLGREVLEA